ncbi:hypothetical protein HOF78_01375 [Candidatus Woesearchaeota archaeon]|jgi:hypothetical protein|nr:hypothetical protein [Candidatus Woesearchaeota archaeon]MBT6044965.1 hypothetical protein [Candidatus Woesearchaeota archaeon]
MVVEKYTLVTTSGESYMVERDSTCLSWLPHERFKVRIPLVNGQRPHKFRYRQGKRIFRGDLAKKSDWYNLVGFLKEGTDYSGNVLEITGNRSLPLEIFLKEGSNENGSPFVSISQVGDIGELRGFRPWLVREGEGMVTSHYRILPAIDEVLEGWQAKSD